MGWTYHWAGELELAEKFYLDALHRKEKLAGQNIFIANIHSYLSSIYNSRKEFDKSILQSQKGLKVLGYYDGCDIDTLENLTSLPIYLNEGTKIYYRKYLTSNNIEDLLKANVQADKTIDCLLYTSPSPRDRG